MRTRFLACITVLLSAFVVLPSTKANYSVRSTTTLWDGWRPVLEIDYAGADGVETAQRYYTWGPDVSGSLDGAAGIGGLLEILEQKGGVTTVSLPVYDGAGNPVAWVDGTSGALVASCQYGPFGELLGVSGPRAASLPFGYQTKLYDPETALSYFGGRYYDAKTATWLSRDPLREAGGVNLYAYCGNDPVTQHDPIGLDPTVLFLTQGVDPDKRAEIARMQAGLAKDFAVRVLTSPYRLGLYAGEQGVAAYELARATGSSNGEALTLATGVTVTRVTGALDLIEATAGGQQIVGDSQSGLQMQDFSSGWQRTFHGVGGGLQLLGTALPIGSGLMRAARPFTSPAAILDLAAESTFTARQMSILQKNVGYNISPESWFSKYSSLGREGSFVTDYRAVGEILGPVRASNAFSVGLFPGKGQVSLFKAWRLEKALGLERGTLMDGFRFTRIQGVGEMAPRSPLFGNRYFLGPGKGLPGGGPEVVIDSIPTSPWP